MKSDLKAFARVCRKKYCRSRAGKMRLLLQALVHSLCVGEGGECRGREGLGLCGGVFDRWSRGGEKSRRSAKCINFL